MSLAYPIINPRTDNPREVLHWRELVKKNLDDLDTRVDANDSDIAANASDIATNAANIAGLTASFTWDPGSLLDGDGETSAAITVTGANFGDYVQVAAPYDLQGLICTAWVSAADTVKVRLQNETGLTVDLASGTWKVKVTS